MYQNKKHRLQIMRSVDGGGAMPIFGSVQELRAYLQGAINDTLQKEVSDVATDSMVQAVESTVYNYEPAMYKRRGSSGGLGSEDNVSKEMMGDGVLFVSNTTKSSPSVVDGSVSDKLTEWIVYGKVPNIFNSNEYAWMYPRDFIAVAGNDLQGDKLKSAVIAGMGRNGARLK